MKVPLNYISVVRGFSKSHLGIDFGWYSNEHKNQNILACDDGIIIYKKYQITGGYVLIIKHDNGYCSVYGHLLKGSITVNKNDSVKKGDTIAKMGNTGISSGNHLHFALYKGNSVSFVKSKYINPVPYLNIYNNQSVNKKSYGIFKHTKYTTEDLNVRNKPTVTGKVMYIAKKNSEIENQGIKEGWNIVDNLKGYYCSNKYLK